MWRWLLQGRPPGGTVAGSPRGWTVLARPQGFPSERRGKPTLPVGRLPAVAPERGKALVQGRTTPVSGERAGRAGPAPTRRWRRRSESSSVAGRTWSRVAERPACRAV
jgi:hypothetical protein